MPRDAVSRTANVGTVGKNGLSPSVPYCTEMSRDISGVSGFNRALHDEPRDSSLSERCPTSRCRFSSLAQVYVTAFQEADNRLDFFYHPPPFSLSVQYCCDVSGVFYISGRALIKVSAIAERR